MIKIYYAIIIISLSSCGQIYHPSTTDHDDLQREIEIQNIQLKMYIQ